MKVHQVYLAEINVDYGRTLYVGIFKSREKAIKAWETIKSKYPPNTLLYIQEFTLDEVNL